MDLYAKAERRDDKRGRTEAQSLPGLFGAGDGQRWLILPRRRELAAAIQPLRGTTDLVRRLLALERIPGVPGDRPIPIPSSDELLVRSGEEPTEADVRAALEAATFYARRMFDEILSVGAKPAPIFAAGGWARSQAFIELRASIFGQPVTVVDEPELTAIGAALIAAQGAGVALPFAEGLNRARNSAGDGLGRTICRTLSRLPRAA